MRGFIFQTSICRGGGGHWAGHAVYHPPSVFPLPTHTPGLFCHSTSSAGENLSVADLERVWPFFRADVAVFQSSCGRFTASVAVFQSRCGRFSEQVWPCLRAGMAISRPFLQYLSTVETKRLNDAFLEILHPSAINEFTKATCVISELRVLNVSQSNKSKANQHGT